MTPPERIPTGTGPERFTDQQWADMWRASEKAADDGRQWAEMERLRRDVEPMLPPEKRCDVQNTYGGSMPKGGGRCRLPRGHEGEHGYRAFWLAGSPWVAFTPEP